MCMFLRNIELRLGMPRLSSVIDDFIMNWIWKCNLFVYDVGK